MIVTTRRTVRWESHTVDRLHLGPQRHEAILTHRSLRLVKTYNLIKDVRDSA